MAAVQERNGAFRIHLCQQDRRPTSPSAAPKPRKLTSCSPCSATARSAPWHAGRRTAPQPLLAILAPHLVVTSRV